MWTVTRPRSRWSPVQNHMMGLLFLSFWIQINLGAGMVKVEEVQGGGWETISHSLSLVQRLEALLVHGNGSDVALKVQTVEAEQVKVIQAHSLVLSLQSPVFEELLVNRNGTTLVLLETAECADIFDKFIRYLYCGDISLRLDQATPLHKLATKYRVQGLQRGVTQYMIQNLAANSPSGHVVEWYQYALQIGDEVLRSSCLQYLSWNLSSILRTDEWMTVSNELLMTLMKRSDLILQSEMELFAALEIWIKQNQPDGLTVENTLRAVRYAMMPPRELFRLQTQSLLLTRYQESVRDLLFLSFQYHSASPLHMAKYFDVNCSLFTPRNYLSGEWGSPWVINNPTRDDRSISFQTQLGPSSYDANKRVTWNALFSPRWFPLSMRTVFSEQGSMQSTRIEGGRPRIIITPATSSADFAGVSFQKTVLVMAWKHGKMVVRNVYNFHQSTEEAGDFLLDADLTRKTSEFLSDGSLHLHILVKPLYQPLIATKK
ncbi:hypothetical protein DPEC_G00030360 [Dallia pectoralis]|uniref:Uncharacterized protein n=1 Tax=Dallia pectoralis TaxID=75939 RepID=A0ACC2HDB1_DALPE|nr:hypothetical protein DPEC_G00030360 [Dallia pectoralis]